MPVSYTHLDVYKRQVDMQPCPRQNKESRHRQPAHSLRIAAKAQKEVAQLGKTYAIQIEDQSIHPLGVLQPVLLSAICKRCV